MTVPTPSTQAIGFHSITIGNDTDGYKNTWDDWHLVPSSRPLIAPPPIKSSYLELVGGDGFIDMTESLAGKTVYGNRSGSWEFIVINPGQVPSDTVFKQWSVLYSDIMRFLHGKKHNIILNDESGWYYAGRLSVNAWNPGQHNSTIAINYNVDPYKRNVTNSNTKKF